MKKQRLVAAATAVGLGITSALAFAAPATAADYYYEDGDLLTELPSYPGYPDNEWFTGINPGPAAAPDFTADGLVLTGRTMLLHGTSELPLTGDLFIELVQGASVDADGAWSFQLPVFLSGDSQGSFTTFRPASANTVPGDLESTWITSNAVGGYGANATLSLADIADLVDDFDLDLNPVLLAFGVLVDSGSTTLASVTFDGDTHYFTAAVDDEDEGDDEDEDPAGPATPVEGPASFTG